jgi:hypothetical protein
MTATSNDCFAPNTIPDCRRPSRYPEPVRDLMVHVRSLANDKKSCALTPLVMSSYANVVARQCRGDAMGALVGSNDVLRELRRVFGRPNSPEYTTAQGARGLFGGIVVGPGNGQDLVAAYKAAGASVSAPWESYLQNLSPENVFAIAQARFDGLTRGVAMKVKTHTPGGGARRVHVSREADGSVMIDSPFP